MALVPTTNGASVFAEVDMGSESSAQTVRVTVVQASTVFYDTPATLEKAERLVADAAAYGAQLVVFPEAFIGGYPRGSNFGAVIGSRSAKGKEEFRKYHASAIDVPGPEVDRLAGIAGKYRIYLVMGVIEREGYTLYCTVLFFDSQGQYMGKHRKLMPTGLERLIWGFGDGSTIPVYETPIGKIGALICWENKMPLLRTAMYAKGIEIYCAPTADARDLWQASMTHIALEGGCFVLSANQFCRRKDYPPPPDYIFGGSEDAELSPDSVVCAGGSVIISPSGAVLAGPNYEGEALISADLDFGEIARAKFDFDVVGHYARPDVLSLTVKDHPLNPVSFTSAAKTESSQKLLEVVNLRSYSGKAKAVGVVVCMAGVVTMAIYIGPSLAFLSHSIHRHSRETINRNGLNNLSSKNWMKGSFLMLSANATWSLWIVMQAGALKAYPSKLLLTTLQCFFSTVQTAIVALAFERKPSKWKLGLDLQLLSVAYCGIVVTGITFWLRVWCIEKKGAVFTTLFTPLSLLITVVFSTLLLGETITLGSVVGQAFLIGGLYGVQWGKYQDQMDTKPVDEHEDKYSDMKEML